MTLEKKFLSASEMCVEARTCWPLHLDSTKVCFRASLSALKLKHHDIVKSVDVVAEKTSHHCHHV